MSGPPVPPADLAVQPQTMVDYILAPLPPWLSDREAGIRYMFNLGVQLNGGLEWSRYGVIQRFPGLPEAQPEAVVLQGKDRQISRGRYEPDGSYRERVRTARTTWSLAGNAQTLLEQVRAYFLPAPPLLRYVVNGYDQDGVQFAEWWTCLPDGSLSRRRVTPSNWDFDGAGPGQFRFWLMIYNTVTPIYWGSAATPPGPPSTGLYWGSQADGGSGASWGFLEASTWYVDVKQIVQQWKAAGTHAGTLVQGCDAGIIAVFDPLMFDPSYPPGGVPGYPMPTGDWGDWSVRAAAVQGPPALCLFLSGV